MQETGYLPRHCKAFTLSVFGRGSESRVRVGGVDDHDVVTPIFLCIYLCNLPLHPEQAKRGFLSDKGRIVSLVE